jgi:4-diphosphocytidyl-2-C-methyl-D-erythritol kinase
MTGSGSAVFAHMLPHIDLKNAPDAFQVKVCNSLDFHPLLGWAFSDSLSVDSF